LTKLVSKPDLYAFLSLKTRDEQNLIFAEPRGLSALSLWPKSDAQEIKQLQFAMRPLVVGSIFADCASLSERYADDVADG
jgi:hypothetical protein